MGSNTASGDERSSAAIEAVILTALRSNLTHNRSGLPPFRLPQVARQIAAALADFLAHPDPAQATQFGDRLGQAGLAMQSLLAVGQVLMATLRAADGDVNVNVNDSDSDSDNDIAIDGSLAEARRIHEFTTSALAGLARYEMQAVLRQRDETQAALARAIHSREAELRQVIVELSTPVMPIHERLLVFPLIGAIDEERTIRITEHLLREVVRYQALIVLIDITGVPASGPAVAAGLSRAMRAARLLGARSVLVGVQPEMARLLVEVADTATLTTHATLQTGIEWALRELGLSIQSHTPGQSPVHTLGSRRAKQRPRERPPA